MSDLIETENGNDNSIVMGSQNSVIGEGKDGTVVGPSGHGTRNESGERPVEQRKMAVVNTCFEHVNRCSCTWNTPGDTGRLRLDYIPGPTKV